MRCTTLYVTCHLCGVWQVTMHKQVSWRIRYKGHTLHSCMCILARANKQLQRISCPTLDMHVELRTCIRYIYAKLASSLPRMQSMRMRFKGGLYKPVVLLCVRGWTALPGAQNHTGLRTCAVSLNMAANPPGRLDKEETWHARSRSPVHPARALAAAQQTVIPSLHGASSSPCGSVLLPRLAVASGASSSSARCALPRLQTEVLRDEQCAEPAD